jgi:TetR/AcrR family transcriptional regulator, cholesterol catabolism regulator
VRNSSREAILRVFAESVADRGYADTSLGDIATELNLSKGTIVHHFGTKEALLRELHVAYFGRRFAETRHIQEQIPDPVGRLVAIVYALLAAHRDDRAASLACLRELVRYSEGEVTAFVREQRVNYTAVLVGVIEDGVVQGVVRAANPKLTALQIFGMCNYAWTWYRPDGSMSAEDIARLFAEDLLRGLVPRAGEVDGLADRVTEAIATVQSAPGRLPAPS